MTRLVARLLALFHRRRRDAELADELSAHLDFATAENLARGLAQDVRYAIRVLWKSPAFTAVAIVSLALGLGATLTMFSLINGLLLRQLPVADPARLVELTTVTRQGRPARVSLPMFESIGERQRVFSGVFGWWGGGIFTAQVGERLSSADVWAVTGNFYAELGTSPLLGRLLQPQDVRLEEGGPTQVAVLGFGFWQRTLRRRSANRRSTTTRRGCAVHDRRRDAARVHGHGGRPGTGRHDSARGGAAHHAADSGGLARRRSSLDLGRRTAEIRSEHRPGARAARNTLAIRADHGAASPAPRRPARGLHGAAASGRLGRDRRGIVSARHVHAAAADADGARPPDSRRRLRQPRGI